MSEYYLEVGSTLGGTNYYGQTAGTNLSATVSGLPTNGSTLYVRLWSKLGTRWAYGDYTYTAAGVPQTKGLLTSPAPGSILTNTTATFTWTPGSGVSEFYLQIGHTPSGTEIYYQSQGTSTSATVTGLPVECSTTLYVSLWSKLGSTWAVDTMTVIVDNPACRSGPTKGLLTSPAAGSTLPGSTATFTWSAGTGVSEYYLQIGRTPTGSEIYYQSQGTNLSATVTGLPTDGSTLYISLWSKLGNVWAVDSRTVTAAFIPTPPSIWNLQLSPTSAPQNSGDVTIYISMNFSDAGGDLSFVRLTDSTTGETMDIPAQKSYTSGSLTIIAVGDTSNGAGSYPFTVQAFDRGGSSSNTLSGTFTVTP